MSDFDLKLPIIEDDVMPPPQLSMDEYLHFVEFCQRCFPNQEFNEEWRKKSVVDVPFVIKD